MHLSRILAATLIVAGASYPAAPSHARDVTTRHLTPGGTTASYDRFNNRTTIAMKTREVYATASVFSLRRNECISIGSFYLAPGDSIPEAKPDSIVFFMVHEASRASMLVEPSWRISEGSDHLLTLLIDGERNDPGPMHYLRGDQARELLNDRCLADAGMWCGSAHPEVLWISMPLDLWLKMTGAKATEGRVGTIQFFPQHGRTIAAYRDFAEFLRSRR